MIRRVAATTALVALFAFSAARARDGGQRNTLVNYQERMEAAVAACNENPEGGVCLAHLRSVLPTTVEALSFLGYKSSYDEAAPLLREFAAYPAPQIQAAAIYALARLGTRDEDLPVLREALLSDVPGVRRAALGALKLMPNPTAQQLVARAGTMPSSYFEPDPLPLDPAAAGVAVWPEGARYLHFQRAYGRASYGFIAKAGVASIIATFESEAGIKSVGMGEIEARFGGAFGAQLKPWIERNATLGAVRAIVLKDASPGTREPVTLALVYEDYALGAPGFALVRLPAEELPRLPRTAETSPPAPTGDAAQWWSSGHLPAKEGAAEDDLAAWRAVLDADGDGAADYLAAFPNGAWRQEAEALLAGPTIDADQDIYAETDTIKVNWRGLPPGVTAHITLGRAGDERLWNTQAQQTPEIATEQGAAELTYYPVIEPGVYDLRVIDAEGEPLATTQIRIDVASVQLSIPRDSYKPGEEIAVTFAGMAGKPRDYISIVKKGVPANEAGSVRAETGGASEGGVTMAAPREPGDYELRAWFERDERVRARLPFTVKGPDTPPAFPTPPVAPAVMLAADSFSANEVIAVRVGGLPDGRGHYISVAPAGAPPRGYYVYKDIEAVGGLFEIKLPPEPGAYELRVHAGGDTIMASAPFTLTAPEGAGSARLTLAKDSFTPGEPISVDFAGMSGASGNYLAVAKTGARYREHLSYVRTKNAADGAAELVAPKEPGRYEIRAFFNDDADVLRGAVSFTVAAP